jgi:hypothetical protein
MALEVAGSYYLLATVGPLEDVRQPGAGSWVEALLTHVLEVLFMRVQPVTRSLTRGCQRLPSQSGASLLGGERDKRT